MRNKLLGLAIFLSMASAASAIDRAQGWCELGGNKVTTGGVTSTTQVQASYPRCTVTVYLTGTLTLATIYSNSGMTPLANPFTADQFGLWFFYAANGNYDVQISGGGPPSLPTPYTFGDIPLGSSGGGGSGTVTQVSGTGPSWLTWNIGAPTTTPSITLSPTTAQTPGQVIGTCGAATSFAPCALVVSDIPGPLNQSTTGNAATATALAVTPSQCTGIQAAQGIAANGNANCYTPSGGGGTNLCGTSISTTTLTAENTASSGTPCSYQVNSTGTIFNFTASPTTVISGAPTGNGTFCLYVDPSGAETMQLSTSAGGTFTPTGMVVLTVSAPCGTGFPAGVYPKATGTVTASSSNWTTIVPIVLAGNYTNPVAGNGIAPILNGVYGIDSTVPQKGATNVFTGAQDYTAATRTSIQTGTSLPATCVVGDLYFKSNATAGQNIYECQTTNTWTQQLNSGGGSGIWTAASVAITSAQIKAMSVTPVTLVAAPGAGMYVEIQSVGILYLYGSATYTGGGPLFVGYGNGTSIIGGFPSSYPSSTFTATSSQVAWQGATNAQTDSVTGIANQSVVLSNITSAFATGDGTAFAHVVYRVVSTTN